MMSIKSMSRFIFFFLTCECPVAPAPSVKKTLLTALYYLLSLVKYQLIIFIEVRGRIQSLSLDSDLFLYLSICCCSVTKLCLILRSPMDSSMPACQASLSLTISWSLPKFMFAESVMPSNTFHALSPSSPSAFALFQHQGLFQ